MQTKNALIVIDAACGASEFSRVQETVRLLLSSGERIDVLSFMDDASLEARLKAGGGAGLSYHRASELLGRIAWNAREEMTRFVSDIRDRLVALAFSRGKKWGERFSKLWWYTLLSQKNSPLEDVWWVYFRLKATQWKLRSAAYSRCLFFGGGAFRELLRQHCRSQGIPFQGHGLRQGTVLKNLLQRAYAALGMLWAVRIAQSHEDTAPKSPVLALSWPEFWAEKTQGWQDIYYGASLGGSCVYALGLHGRAFIPFHEIRRQRERIKDVRWRSVTAFPLERFGTWRMVLGEYLKASDMARFLLMAVTKRYKRAFMHQGLDYREALSPLLWESSILLWPFFLCQEKMAARATAALQPQAVVFYSFEFLAGRAWLAGVKSVTDKPVIALQHGPMTPMKLNYAATPEEGRPTGQGGAARVEADLYLVDGPSGRDLLAEGGINPVKIKVVGAPRLDAAWKEAVRGREEARFQSRPLRILIAPTVHDTEFVVCSVLLALGGRPDLSLVFHAHPKVPRHQVRGFVESFTKGDPTKCVVTVSEAPDIFSLMAQSDILIGTYSSVLTEAPVFGVAPVLLASNRKADMSPFVGPYADRVLKANGPERLRECIDKLAANQEFRRKYLTDQMEVARWIFGPLEGSASLAVSSILENTI